MTNPFENPNAVPVPEEEIIISEENEAPVTRTNLETSAISPIEDEVVTTEAKEVKENLFTKENVLRLMEEYAQEGQEIVIEEERSDNDGLYYLKTEILNDKTGAPVSFLFMRSGDRPQDPKTTTVETKLIGEYDYGGGMFVPEDLAWYSGIEEAWKKCTEINPDLLK